MLGTGENSELNAYRKLLNSQIAHMAGTVPGSSELMEVAETYLRDHKLKGHPLPYFNPLDPKELASYAIVAGVNFVVYKYANPTRIKIVHVVADTRLLACNFDGPCVHVLLREDGMATRFRMKNKIILNMVCKEKMPETATFGSPLQLVQNYVSDLDDRTEVELANLTFYSVRQKISNLNKLAAALGRPIRLMAVSHTSRYAIGRKLIPSTWKISAVEQRISSNCLDGELLTVYLTVDEHNVVLASTNLSEERFAKRSSKGARKPDFAKVPEEVKAAIKRKGDDEVEEKTFDEGDVGKRLKLTPHVRIDDCCNLEVGRGMCEACAEVNDDYKSSKRPPIDSSGSLCNPQKNCTSILAEARSIGLCEMFPDLEKWINIANMVSVTTMDLETISVDTDDGSSKAGSSGVPFSSSEYRSGTSTLVKHVVFMIGSCSFKIKAVERFSAKDLIWRINQESSVYKVFKVTTTSGVPSQTEVHKCIRKWLSYMHVRQRTVEHFKRKLLKPVLDMLQEFEDKSNATIASTENEKMPAFSNTIFGKVLQSLRRLCSTVNVVTYNGNRFDILHILPTLLMESEKKKFKITLGRKGTEMRFLRIKNLNFFDLFKLTTEGSLMRLAQLLGVEGKTRTRLKKEMVIPYLYFDRMERLLGNNVPSIDDPAWLSLKTADRMITEEEHQEISREVKSSNWYDLFLTYLRKDCVLTLACLVIMDELYRRDFGVDLLGCNYTSAGAVVTSFIDEQINRACVQGFSQIRNSTIGKLILRSRLGGIVESRVRKTGELFESEDRADPEQVFGFDLNQLYPSMQYMYKNMYGEPTLYSDAYGSGVLEQTSNLTPYGQEYKMLMFCKAQLIGEGYKILAIYSNYTNEKRMLLPKYIPDGTFFTLNKYGDLEMVIFQFDGFYHVRINGLHQSSCRFNNGDNDMELSPYYVDSLETDAARRKMMTTVFSSHYGLRFINFTQCAFHNPVELEGECFQSVKEAFDHIRRSRPEMCISADHPKSMSLQEVMFDKPRADGSVLAGFVVHRAKCDPAKVMADGTRQFGMLYDDCPCPYENLSEYSQNEIKRLVAMQSPSSKAAERTLKKYKVELGKTRRLHLRNSHVRYAVSTIDHFRFLVSIGCEILEVKHVILFASLTEKSHECHPHRLTIGNLLTNREKLQKRKAELEKMTILTPAEKNEVELLTTLSFLAKISINSQYGRASLLKDRQSSVKTGRNMLSAARNKANWLKRIKKTDIAGVTFTKFGPEVTFVTESQSKRLRFTNLQTAVAILDNSKFHLVNTQYHFALLYPKVNYVLEYGDTDSLYVAMRHRNLKDNERKELTDEQRERYRAVLYGAEGGNKFGRCKIEVQAKRMTIVGPKCYFLTDDDLETGEKTVKSVKFKGSSAASRLPISTLEALGERETLLKERSVRMARSSFGTSLVSTEKLLAGFRSIDVKRYFLSPTESRPYD